MIFKKYFLKCSCGNIYRTKLEMFEKSVPHGLQVTFKSYGRDFELRHCVECGSTFGIDFPRNLVEKLNETVQERDGNPAFNIPDL